MPRNEENVMQKMNNRYVIRGIRSFNAFFSYHVAVLFRFNSDTHQRRDVQISNYILWR